MRYAMYARDRKRLYLRVCLARETKRGALVVWVVNPRLEVGGRAADIDALTYMAQWVPSFGSVEETLTILERQEGSEVLRLSRVTPRTQGSSFYSEENRSVRVDVYPVCFHMIAGANLVSHLCRPSINVPL